MYVCYYARAHTHTRGSSNVRDTRGCTIRARTGAPRWFAYTYGEESGWHTERERERVVIERKENEREGLERRRKKKRREKKKRFGFRSTSTWLFVPETWRVHQDGKRVRDRANGREREREREGRENRESSIDPGYVHICKYIYPGSTGLLS